MLRPEHPDQTKALGQAAITYRRDYRDYIDKRNQYEWRSIPEYWIMDPVKAQVTVLFLTEDGYEETVFVGDEAVKSPSFEDWSLTATKMLSV